MKKTRLEYPQLLNKRKILLLGKNSTLGKKLYREIDKNKFLILQTSRKELNFQNSNCKKKLNKILNKNKPDIIINMIGKFELNETSNFDVVKINVLPTWLLIDFYLKKRNKKKIKIIIIGSSSYSSPRKRYMLYASSKSALNSLVRSAKENFHNTQIDIKIFNPRTFGGKHLSNFKKVINEDINKVAKSIYRYISLK